MFKITGRLRNAARLERRIEELGRDIEKAAFEGLQDGADIVVNHAKRLVAKGPKTGRTYKKYRPKRTHRASAPGEAPATDTGRLLNSIRARTAKKKLTIEVMAGTKYARWLEYGTRRIKPRPFLRRALREKRVEVTEIVQDYIRETIVKGR